MAGEVKWIKFQVNTFDGLSFKKIKKAKIDGIIDFRDKLTAVWFELLALAGKVNNDGSLSSEEMPFENLEDIATLIDRTDRELDICIKWFIANGMIVIEDNVYKVSNWLKFQDLSELKKLQNNRERQRRFRERQKISYNRDNNESNGYVTESNTLRIREDKIRVDKDIDKNIKEIDKEKRFTPPTHKEIIEYLTTENYDLDDYQHFADKFINHYESVNWKIGKNKMAKWRSAVAGWLSRDGCKKREVKKKIKEADNDEVWDELKTL